MRTNEKKLDFSFILTRRFNWKITIRAKSNIYVSFVVYCNGEREFIYRDSELVVYLLSFKTVGKKGETDKT